MPAKKSTRVKSSARAKRPAGLTSAIGPKATTMVVIVVMAGGILVAARQQSRPKEDSTIRASAELASVPGSPAGAVMQKDARPAAFASAAGAASAPGNAAASTKAPPVTVTGCLERSGDAFRLKNTAGESAPKSRSWKSGFLKKGTASIQVVDAGHALALASHVGERVSMSGPLVDREMQARSLRRIAASCDK